MANLRRFTSRMQAKEQSDRRKEHEEEYQIRLKETGEIEKRDSKNFFQLIGAMFSSTSFASKDKISEAEQPLLAKISQ